MSKTIIDYYIENYGKLIIAISGMSGSNKTEVGHAIAKALNGHYINENKFFDESYEKMVNINGHNIKSWDSDDAILWDKLNKEVNSQLKTNKIIVISGISFDRENIQFDIDYHIHLKMGKQKILEKRQEFLQKHMTDEKYKDNINLDEQTEKQFLNQITYPYYLKTIENSDINKFINLNELSEDKILEEVFKNIITFTENKIYKDRNDLKWNNELKSFDYVN